MKRYAWLLVSLVALLAGCAGQIKPLPIKVADKAGNLHQAYIATTTSGDTLDRSSSYTQIGVETGQKDDQGKPVLKQLSGEMTHGPTVGGQMAVGITQGLGVGFLQYRAAKEASCNSGNCGDQYYLQGGSAVSNAVNNNASKVKAVVGTCPPGKCW